MCMIPTHIHTHVHMHGCAHTRAKQPSHTQTGPPSPKSSFTRFNHCLTGKSIKQIQSVQFTQSDQNTGLSSHRIKIVSVLFRRRTHYSFGALGVSVGERSLGKWDMIGEWLFAVSHRGDMKIHREEELPLSLSLVGIDHRSMAEEIGWRNSGTGCGVGAEAVW